MPRKKRFYFEREQSDLNPAEDDVKEDELEFLEEIPYYSSSSSADRSSIGSIPWADDAIKQNQIDWERVERMLCGEEDLPENEPELRNEILEWQSKFPQLLSAGSKTPMEEKSFDSMVETNLGDTTLELLDSLSNLSLNSFVDDDDNASNGRTSTKKYESAAAYAKRRKLISSPNDNVEQRSDLAKLFGRSLHINSVRLALRQCQAKTGNNTVAFKSSDSESSAASSVSSPVPHATQSLSQYPVPLPLNNLQSYSLPPQRCVATALHSRPFRMPPVPNVLESKRRFRESVNNRSFVQLTQVQQVKSAAVAMPQSRQPVVRRSGFGNQSAWHPLAAAAAASSRFSNNRNAIILPALNPHRFYDNRTASLASEVTNNLSKTSGNSTAAFASRRHHFVPQRNLNYIPSPTSTATPSTRSISAAMHNPRGDLRAIYLPYSASKFEVIN